MSKIKIMDANKVLVEESNTLFDKILSMQSEADNQIRDIRSFEKKILEIQKKKQIEETLLSEKIAMQKMFEMQKAQEAKEKAEIAAMQKTEAVPVEPVQPMAEKIVEKPVAKTENVPVKVTEEKSAAVETVHEKPIEKTEIVAEKVQSVETVVQPAEKAEQTQKEVASEKRDVETKSTVSPNQETRSFNGYNGENRQQNRQDYQNRDNQGQQRPPYNRDNQGQQRPPYNRDNPDQQRQPYNRDNPDQQRQPYNRDNQGQRPPYNRDNQGQQRPYNRDNPDQQRQPYNRDNPDQQRQPYNRDNQGQQRPPYNRDNQGQQRPPYNRDNQGQYQGQSRPPYNNQGQSRPPYNNQGQQGQSRPPYNNQGQSRPPYNNNNQGGQYAGQNRPSYNNNGAVHSRPSFNPYPRNDFAKDKDADLDHPVKRAVKPKNDSKPGDLAPALEKNKVSNYDNKKFKKPTAEEAKQKAVKKGGIKEHVVLSEDEELRLGSRKRRRKPQEKVVFEPIVIEKAIITSDTLSVKLFAEKIGKPVSDILKKLLLLGMMCTINSQIDYDTAALIASEFGIELENRVEQTAEETLTASADEELDATEDLIKRPPVVTIMGHVDHGKTSLLDKIRSTKVTESEAGGITQHIGAYQIKVNGNPITFIDTPGHEAFTAMRARGAQVTDVVILVVAADDGVMPQTIEAINHAKSAHVPIIVAINKIDREGANVEKIKQALTEYELVAEEWGGDTIMVPVSATTGQGIDTLLDMIILVSEVQELKANPNRFAKGTIVEAKLDKGRGPVATVLIQNGTLRVQDAIVAGTAIGRVRAMVDDNGNNVQEAGPSKPVEVVGFAQVPEAGDIMYAVQQDKLSKQVVEERKDKQKADMLKKMTKISLDDLFTQIAEGQIKELDVIIKADVQGSVEAMKQSLEKLSNDEVHVRAIQWGVGAIKETDVMLASAANAIIIGFNVRPEAKAKTAAEHEKVDIRLYRVIYKAIEDIQNAMTGMLDPEFEEIILGHVEVRQTFKVSSVGTIAGCYVTDGKIQRNSMIRLLRDNIVVHEAKISSLKRFKDDVKEVATGYECGISLENYNDIKEADIMESYIVKEKERAAKVKD